MRLPVARNSLLKCRSRFHRWNWGRFLGHLRIFRASRRACDSWIGWLTNLSSAADLSQLRQLYPNDWQTIVNNSGVLQVFGITNHHMAREWGELLGQRPEDLAKLAREDAVVLRQGQEAVVCRRPDYLQDEMFAGLFDANQRFALQGQPNPRRV